MKYLKTDKWYTNAKASNTKKAENSLAQANH